jgi:hypothetical protein
MPRLVAGAKVEVRTPGQEGGRPGGGRRPGGGAPGGAAPGGAAPDAGGKAPAKAQP